VKKKTCTPGYHVEETRSKLQKCRPRIRDMELCFGLSQKEWNSSPKKGILVEPIVFVIKL